MVLSELQSEAAIIDAELKAQITLLLEPNCIPDLQIRQQANSILVAAVTAYIASQISATTTTTTTTTAPAPAPTPTVASAPTPATFKPASQTPNDIYTSAATLAITDTLSRNIICTGSTATHVTSFKASNVWVALPDTPDGGKVWQDQHSDGQTLTLYFCAPGIGNTP
jgi:hypothetical protein